MFEKPDISDTTVIASLCTTYGLPIAEITFLPIGADRHTAVYRATTPESTAYFVKLRGGDFNDMTLRIPRLLYDQGITPVIPPLTTHAGALWMETDGYALAVYPFVAGQDAYAVPMLDRHWVELGQAFQAIHAVIIPPDLAGRIPRETYTSHYRDTVRRFLQTTAEATYSDPVSAGLAALLSHQHATINRIISRAESLAARLKAESSPLVLCHADMHAGNVLLDSAGGLHIVDWDTLILAPKERDLMYAGGGLFPNQRTPQEEETLFYRGYSSAQPDPAGLAYYRYERIVQDIAAYCEQILYTEPHNADRAVGLRQLTGQFTPGEVVEIALCGEDELR
ncbi:MAG: aminoglycoside phosphotransferase family protein [Anaerolineaceae bacterium]|nr:aminoglycoside phosphotransferase family protein [Anaerolineaceae bacterium]